MSLTVSSPQGNAYHNYNNYSNYPSDYGTYSTYNNNDLYNEPRTYPTPPPTYTTPPPNYEQAYNTPPANRGGDGGVQRGNTQQEPPTDSLNRSDLSEAETSRTEGGGTDLETSVSLNDSREDSGGIAQNLEVDETRDITRDNTCDIARDRVGDDESAESREDSGQVSPLGSMWDRYLRRTFERKTKKRPDSGSNTLESERSNFGG